MRRGRERLITGTLGRILQGVALDSGSVPGASREEEMSGIYVALGANLPHPTLGAPRRVLEAALGALEEQGIAVRRRSRWYRSAPVPASDQPWYVNGVAEVESTLAPAALLQRLHAIEAAFGRERGLPNAARILDLDLLDHRGAVSRPGESPVLPHPRLHLRGFVLLPLRDLEPDWRHPVDGRPLAELIAGLPADQQTEPLE